MSKDWFGLYFGRAGYAAAVLPPTTKSIAL